MRLISAGSKVQILSGPRSKAAVACAVLSVSGLRMNPLEDSGHYNEILSRCAQPASHNEPRSCCRVSCAATAEGLDPEDRFQAFDAPERIGSLHRRGSQKP